MKLSSWCLLVRSFVRYSLRKRNSISGQNAFQWCTNCIKVGSPPKHRWRSNCLHLEMYPNTFASILLKYPDNGTKMQIKKRIFVVPRNKFFEPIYCVFTGHTKNVKILMLIDFTMQEISKECVQPPQDELNKKARAKSFLFFLLFLCASAFMRHFS